ncbi:hypothetical protein DFJ77DRAFT_478776 [Powellomyces hirtus]|nr:hypothetical protein DFJ77DRAFT_478776 [Powellomyces hirtus]
MKSFLRTAFGILLVLLALTSAFAQEADDYDDEEDEQVSAHQRLTTGRIQSPLTQGTPADVSPSYSWKDVKWQNLKIEILIISTLVAYVLNYFIGKSWNKKLVRNWYQNTSSIWERNFAHVGDVSGHKLINDGVRTYVLHASGRVHVKNIYGRIRLAPRYDMVQRALAVIQGQTTSHDRLTLTVTLKSEESESMVFAILLKDMVKKIMDARWDLSEFPKKREMPTRSGPFPSQYYTVFAEAPEFLSMMWEDPDVRKCLWASMGLDAEGNGSPFHYPLIEQIVLTDLPREKPLKLDELDNIPKTLTFVIRLPNLARLNERAINSMNDVLELVFLFVDYIGQHGKVNPETKAKIAKVRAAATQSILKAAEEERKEELAQKKYQEKRAREQQLTKLSPEEQRKYEERERKKELKRAQNKKVKKI